MNYVGLMMIRVSVKQQRVAWDVQVSQGVTDIVGTISIIFHYKIAVKF